MTKIKLTDKEAVAVLLAVRKRLDSIDPRSTEVDVLHRAKAKLEDAARKALRKPDPETCGGPTLIAFPPRRTEAWFEPGVGWHPPDPDPRISPPR